VATITGAGVMMGLTFDQVERYRGAAFVIDFLWKHVDDSEKTLADKPDVLDVGGLFKTLSGDLVLPGKLLLPEYKCRVVDTQQAELPDYTQITPDKPLPFRDNAYEVTICMDVLEHIPPAQRNSFFVETLRVTSGVLILAAPFYHAQREMADRWLAEYSEKLLDYANPMLREHLENGLPETAELEAVLKDQNLKYTVFSNGELGKWRLIMALKHLIQQVSGPEGAMKFEHEMLPWAEPVCTEEPGYRYVYVVFKRPDLSPEPVIKAVKNFRDQSRRGKRAMPDENAASVIAKYLERVGMSVRELNKILNQLRLSENRLNREKRKQKVHMRGLTAEVDKLQSRNIEQAKYYENKESELGRHILEYERSLQELRKSTVFRTGQAVLAPLKACLKMLPKSGLHKISEVLKQQKILTTSAPDIPLNSFAVKPFFSILVPVYNTEERVLREMLDSVTAQTWSLWELCLVDDASPNETPRNIIHEYAEKHPNKIKIHFCKTNGGIAVATNYAASMATGDFICLLDHDDLLARDALMEVALQLQVRNDTDYFYSDEDKVSFDSREFSQPYFKPDFDPDLLLCSNYLNHFSVIRRSLFLDVGGFRVGYDGSQDYDLYLRVTEKARRIVHIPKVLYHWRMVPESTAVDPEAKGGLFRDSSVKALQAAIDRRNLDATVEKGVSPGSYRVRYAVPDDKKVCIIIPTRNSVELVDMCVTSIETHTDHKQYEFLIVDNGSDDPLLEAWLSQKKNESGRFRSLRFDGRFNFSSINNYAVQNTDAEYLLFLNNDIEVTRHGWLTAMLEFAQQPDVGAVGAKLLYPDGRIQHAGVVLGMGGVAGHPFKEMPEHNGVYFGHSNMIKNYSAVTAACILMRREVFEIAGGFNEELAVSFGDIDLCMEIRKLGYKIVYTPYARLIHHESVSRLDDNETPRRPRFHSEITYMLSKWGRNLFEDPFLNPNISILKYDMSPRGLGENETLESFRKAFSGFIPGLK
jgi:glycosyltransferase involved in cell wall biosynthesis